MSTKQPCRLLGGPRDLNSRAGSDSFLLLRGEATAELSVARCPARCGLPSAAHARGWFIAQRVSRRSVPRALDWCHFPTGLRWPCGAVQDFTFERVAALVF